MTSKKSIKKNKSLKRKSLKRKSSKRKYELIKKIEDAYGPELTKDEYNEIIDEITLKMIMKDFKTR